MAKPLFQHRHYVKMAEIIASMDSVTRANCASVFSWALRDTNPNFDRERFEAAARGEPVNGRDRGRN